MTSSSNNILNPKFDQLFQLIEARYPHLQYNNIEELRYIVVTVQFDWDFTSELIERIWIEQPKGELYLQEPLPVVNNIGQKVLERLEHPPSWDDLMSDDGFSAKFEVDYDFLYDYDENTGQSRTVVNVLTIDLQYNKLKPDYSFDFNDTPLKDIIEQYIEDFEKSKY